jgi:hypothetical protein
MRIRRNIIAPLILTIGAVGSLVAIPAVSALSAVTPATTVVAAQPDGFIYMGWNTEPGQPPAAIPPIGCGLLAFAMGWRKFSPNELRIFPVDHSIAPDAGHLAAVSVTTGPSAKGCTWIAILISCPQWRPT